MADFEEEFYEKAVAAICDREPAVLGLTSMGVNSHVAIRLATLVRDRLPSCWVVLGGPHFGAIAEVLGELCPFDFVVRGSAEEELRAILQARARNDRPSNPAIVGGPGGPMRALGPRESMRSIDLPAYFAANPVRLGLVESGRGCVFNCSFCYSPGHFGKAVFRSLGHVMDDLKDMKERGFGRLFFVNDNFVNNRRDAMELLETIESSESVIPWHCYATIPTLDPKLASQMGASGCTDVYLGIDAVTDRQSRRYRKRFYGPRTTDAISWLVDAGVTPTAALIFDGSDHEEEEFDRTLTAACELHNAGARVRINLLAAYPGTDLGPNGELRYSDLKAQVSFDVPTAVRHNPLARRYPGAFPFHSTTEREDDWRRILLSVRAANDVLHSPESTDRTLDSRDLIEFSRLMADNKGILEVDKRLWTGIHAQMFARFAR